MFAPVPSVGRVSTLHSRPATAADPLTMTPRRTPFYYPASDWSDDPGHRYYVDPELRDDYLRCRIRPFDAVGTHARAADDVFGPRGGDMTPPEYLHKQRLAFAQQTATKRQREADAQRRHVRSCPVCGVVSDDRHWGQVKPGPVPDLPGALSVCTECVTVVEESLREGFHLPDGRTRRQAADEFVNGWTGRKGPA